MARAAGAARSAAMPATRSEGQVEWVLGVVAAGPYRVLASPGPGRLVVDIRHRP